ncbi:MAG: hypothetical protein PHY14_03815 [Candidatus Gracilibacteria bacterium]|nr:hypothetical protein [Candidatus Gracilibacteria bacterium]
MPKTLNQKEQKREALLRKFAFPKSVRAVILLDIRDDVIHSFIMDASRVLNIGIIESDSEEDMSACDACITDGLGELNLINLTKSSVVSILPKNHPLIGSFSEFDPMKFEGNAFIYDSLNPYLVFEKLIRYLENIRYAGDKRTLLNNVAKTF